MFKLIHYVLISFVTATAGLMAYLTWPLVDIPQPACHECLPMDSQNGHLEPLKLEPSSIYGVALTYAEIIVQTGSEFNSKKRPPIFHKFARAIFKGNGTTPYPSSQQLLEQIEQIESGLGETLRQRFGAIPTLLDYEVELGVVLLKPIDRNQLDHPDFVPQLGYFLANDLQSLIFIILGQGQAVENQFFDAKGSFPGFLPLSKTMWIPNAHAKNTIFCTTISTKVNQELRQSARTRDRIYTNEEIIRYIFQHYNVDRLPKGTAIITGSPGGVANRMPRWKRRLGRLLRMDRVDKLAAVIKAAESNPYFLKPGDTVVIEAEGLGKVETKIR